MEKMLNEKSPVVLPSIIEIFDNILKNGEIETIDVTVRYVEDSITITLTYEGKLLDPITDSINDKIGEIDGDVEYSPILGFNRVYINVAV